MTFKYIFANLQQSAPADTDYILYSLQIKSDGTHNVSWGKMQIKINVRTFAAKNGILPLNIDPIPNPEIAEVTFIHVPTGGVTAPTANPVIRIPPNCIGEIPTATHAGRKTGVSNKIAGLTSIKVPAINIIITMAINIITGGKFIATTYPATASGILSSDKIHI